MPKNKVFGQAGGGKTNEKNNQTTFYTTVYIDGRDHSLNQCKSRQ